MMSLVRGFAAAVGPTVTPTRGGMSLRWARRTLALVDRGIITALGPVRALDHLTTLVTAMSEDLLLAAVHERLRPLMEQPPQRRSQLVPRR
ncbi:hypothetical protein [Actinocorallia herbida]|uniref:hypothetical protein n=1 Tax=Actinocorallia herbida TaxID=58109 RepID=UPI000F4CDB38|nr:hypothetical protein [Actinocorallia herbida]